MSIPKWMTIAWMAVTVILIVMVVRLNIRSWEIEEKLDYTHAAVVIYLTPDEQYVKCAQEVLWREQSQ